MRDRRTDEPRKILAEFYIEEDGTFRLFSVYVVDPITMYDGKPGYSLDGYDVEYSETYGYIYHLTSGGILPDAVSGIYWASPGLSLKERACQLCSCNYESGKLDAETRYIRARNRTRRLKQLPKEFRKAEHFERPIAGVRVKITPGDLMDWLEHNALNDEAVYCSECEDWLPSEDLCEHCWWCDTASYVTPSEGSACFDPDCYECRRARKRRHEAYWRDRRRRIRQGSGGIIPLQVRERPEVRR